jgi:transcription antitermination factor NusG
MAGFMVPRKYRKTTILRKEFLFYDYAFIELGNAMKFERFLSDRKIPAYLLYVPGTKVPVSLTESEISRVRQTEAIKQQEVEKFASPKLRVGSLIEVVNGPFIGCKGTILGLTKTHAVLEMNVFGRPTRVNIGIDFLENLLQDFGPEPTSLLEDEE